ncbi:MAG: hypothetical protein AVDCRST_MAG88-893, partial [uncultured Thermomicrobiales bacterium]
GLLRPHHAGDRPAPGLGAAAGQRRATRVEPRL